MKSDKLTETGGLKNISSAFRQGSQALDLLPLDLIPGAGTFLSEISAAALSGLAASVDVAEKLLKGDITGAGEELVAGTVETALVALPFAEYAITGANMTLGTDIRGSVRRGASGVYNTILGRESSIYKDPQKNIDENNQTASNKSIPSLSQ